MKKLIMWNLITLDGYFEGERPWDLSFHELVWNAELEAYADQQLNEADTLVFGANTYQGMASHWTTTETEGSIAKKMNAIRKVVCSPNLASADWNNTIIVRDAAAEIPNLKQEGDGNMFVFGSGILSRSLMEANLFEEYRLCIVPVFLGKGRRLFEEGLPYQKLELLASQPLSSGGVILKYAPRS